MIRKRGNFYRRSMRWQNLWDLRFCRRSTQRMMKKYMRHLQKKAMQPMTFSCRDWSLMRLRTGGERTLRHGRRRLSVSFSIKAISNWTIRLREKYFLICMNLTCNNITRNMNHIKKASP